MRNEITRENVQAILDRNTANRKEAALDAQERQLRLTINNNHTTRTLTEAQERERAVAEAKKRREARQEAYARDQAREAAATMAVQRYILACGGIVAATALTPFPWWGAAALIPGLAVFPAAYVYRLYWMKMEVKL